MDEIKCPNCGKPNPDVLLKCRYCGTDLPSASKLILPETTALDLPQDWEKSLTPVSGQPAEVEPSSESEADWLRRLRGEVGEAEPGSEAAASTPTVDDAASLILGRLRDQDEAQTPADDQLGGFTPAAEDAELPDWLKAMRSPETSALDSGEAAPSTDTAGVGGDDDWLKAFETSTPAQSAPTTSSLADWQNITPGSTPEEEDDSADWLKSFGEGQAQPVQPSGFANYQSPWAEAESEEQPASKAEVDDDEWMKSLGAAQDARPTLGLDDFKKLAETPVAEEADDSDEWLKSLAARTASESETIEAAAPESLPDWLNAATPPVPSVSAEGIPPVSETDDWLSAFGKAESSAQPETPDWMKGSPETTPPAEEAKPEPSLTAWLSSIGGAVGGPPPGAEPAVSASSPGTSMTADDWLKTFKETAKSDPETAEAAKTGVLPDWLKSITGETASGPAAPSTPSTPSSGASHLPDWLQTFKEAAKSDPDIAGAAQTGVLPDWLADLSASPAAGAPSVDLPEWLHATSEPAGAGTSGAPAAGPSAAPAADVPDWILSPDESSNLTSPDWFEQIQSQAKKKPDTGALDSSVVDPFALQSPAGSTPAIADAEWLDSIKTEKPPSTPAFEGLSATTGQTGQLDWLKGLTSTLPPLPPTPAPSEVDFQVGGEGQPTSGGTGPLAGADLPAWLTEAQPPTPAPATPAFSNDLPDWLTAPPAEATTTVEPAVVPAPFIESVPIEPAPEAPDLAKADLPNWLGTLRPINAPVHLNLGLDYEETVGPLAGLRGILPAESAIAVLGKPGAVVTRFAVSDVEQHQADILRGIVAEETQEAEAKPIRKPRLPIAWDRLIVGLLALALMVLPFLSGVLPPGLFVEPEREDTPSQSQAMTLANVVEALPAGAPVLVAFDYDPASTGELTPAASALLAHLAKRGITVRAVSTYPAGVGVAQNLSVQEAMYLPGGAVGLRRYVTTPENAISGLSLIVVITGSTESAQMWIEQVQALAGEKMAVITSAAAEPFLRPYTQGEKPQLQALVSGLAGGMAYQNKVAGTGTGAAQAQQWDAFALSLNAASLILLAGGMVGGVLMLINRRGEAKPAKPQAQPRREPQSELKRRTSKKKKAVKKGTAAKAKKK